MRKLFLVATVMAANAAHAQAPALPAGPAPTEIGRS
jgi:hypothetical protein